MVSFDNAAMTSFLPEVQTPSMIGEIWMRSMSANMILLLDAAQTFLMAYYTCECMTTADVLHGGVPLIFGSQ